MSLSYQCFHVVFHLAICVLFCTQILLINPPPPNLIFYFLFLSFVYIGLTVFPLSSVPTEKKLAESSKKAATRPKPLSMLRSLEEKYVAAMKKLQFGEFPPGKAMKRKERRREEVREMEGEGEGAKDKSGSWTVSESVYVFFMCDEKRCRV